MPTMASLSLTGEAATVALPTAVETEHFMYLIIFVG
jgi:hypothetical protein